MQSLVNQWKESGFSQAKFAAQLNLTLVKFRYWIHKLNPATESDSAFIQLNGFTTQGISLRVTLRAGASFLPNYRGIALRQKT